MGVRGGQAGGSVLTRRFATRRRVASMGQFPCSRSKRTKSERAMHTVCETPVPLSSAPSRHAADCSSCALKHYCLPQGLSSDDVHRLQTVIVHARTIKRGETLFRVGDTFDTLYAIRSGSIKTVVSTPNGNGREQVMGLH